MASLEQQQPEISPFSELETPNKGPVLSAMSQMNAVNASIVIARRTNEINGLTSSQMNLESLSNYVENFYSASIRAYTKLAQYHNAVMEAAPEERGNFTEMSKTVIEGYKNEIPGEGPSRSLPEFLSAGRRLERELVKLAQGNDDLRTIKELFIKVRVGIDIFQHQAGDFYMEEISDALNNSQNSKLLGFSTLLSKDLEDLNSALKAQNLAEVVDKPGASDAGRGSLSAKANELRAEMKKIVEEHFKLDSVS